MKKIVTLLTLLLASSLVFFAQYNQTRMFTIFTSKGCGCTGSGGPPEVFETHEVVLEKLQQACSGTDFIRFEGSISEGYQEVEGHPNKYDGVLIIVPALAGYTRQPAHPGITAIRPHDQSPPQAPAIGQPKLG